MQKQKEEELLMLLAMNEVSHIQGMQSLFVEPDDLVINSFVESIKNDSLQVVGSQQVSGKIYDQIGYGQINKNDFFKNLVICRLVNPGSKLKTVEYFRRHLNTDVSVYSVCHFLEELYRNKKSICCNWSYKPDLKPVQI